MAKTRYYIINEEGKEELVRTSKTRNNYKYYWHGSCSSTWEGIQKARAELIGYIEKHIMTYGKGLALNDEEFKKWTKKNGNYKRELIEYWYNSDMKFYKEIKEAKVYELIVR